MLAAHKRLHTSSSIPFIPRQVIMLETESAAAAQPAEGKKRRKEKNIDEKKKKKRSSETLENGSAAPSQSLELYRPNGGSSSVEGKGREALLGSIAAFLESNGFSKTLAVFRSEAQVETDGSKTSIMNLEDLFCKFLESSKTTIDWLKEQEKEKLVIHENDKCLNTLDASEHTQKKKRKHRSENDDGMKDELHKTELSSEGCSVENSEKNSKELEASGDGTNLTMSISAESSHVDSKGKKKKKKSYADSITEEADKSHLEDNHGTENSDQQLLVKEKEKRKKKSKIDNPSVSSENFPDMNEQKIEEPKSLTNGFTPSVESNPKHKDEKKKKRKKTLAEDAAKLEGDEVNKKTGTEEIPEKSSPESETLVVSKKKKTKRSSEDSTLPATRSLSEQLIDMDEHKELPGECDSQKEAAGLLLGNGSIDKKGRERNTSSAKKEKHSAEPKTAFQRVKTDDVEFADERLQDNSYWAKDGADIGYGAKAQEILGQVKGRDFRHEKTKKKRGSYRGGQIDFQSHSIKFNYSDEE